MEGSTKAEGYQKEWTMMIMNGSSLGGSRLKVLDTPWGVHLHAEMGKSH